MSKRPLHKCIQVIKSVFSVCYFKIVFIALQMELRLWLWLWAPSVIQAFRFYTEMCVCVHCSLSTIPCESPKKTSSWNSIGFIFNLNNQIVIKRNRYKMCSIFHHVPDIIQLMIWIWSKVPLKLPFQLYGGTVQWKKKDQKIYIKSFLVCACVCARVLQLKLYFIVEVEWVVQDR